MFGVQGYSLFFGCKRVFGGNEEVSRADCLCLGVWLGGWEVEGGGGTGGRWSAVVDRKMMPPSLPPPPCRTPHMPSPFLLHPSSTPPPLLRYPSSTLPHPVSTLFPPPQNPLR